MEDKMPEINTMTKFKKKQVSNTDIILCLFSSWHQVTGQFIQLVMFIMQGFIL